MKPSKSFKSDKVKAAKLSALIQLSEFLNQQPQQPDYKDYDSLFTGTDEDFNNQAEDDGSDINQKFSAIKKKKK
jgi:hypothetical protein